MKKKLCLLTPKHWSAMMGGSQYQVKCLLEMLVSADDFTIYYLTGQYDQHYIPSGYYLIGLPAYGSVGGVSLCRYFSETLKMLNKIKPDIIYQRVGSFYTGFAAWYTKRNNCKMIWHIAHDTDVMPAALNQRLKFRRNLLEKKILEYGLRNCSAIIAQTNQQRLYLKKYYKRDVSAVIPNVQPRPGEEIRKSNSVKVKIVWVANLKKWKQPESFISLARDLDRMNMPVECLMIGKPSRNKAWQESIEQQIAAIGNLSYLGSCSIEQVNSVLNSAHIFVNTSTAEGFPNTFIQAWMRKTPVVSLHCNPDNIFRKYKVGFFAGKYEIMLSQVVNLVKNRPLREELGETAGAYAMNTYSLSNLARLEKVLNEA